MFFDPFELELEITPASIRYKFTRECWAILSTCRFIFHFNEEHTLRVAYSGSIPF